MINQSATHRTTTIVSVNNKNYRMHLRLVGNTEAALHAAIVRTLDLNSLPTTGYTIIKRTPVTALPKPKHGASINTQHDYITMRAVFADGRINMTWSFGGEKVSGVGIGDAGMRTAIRAMKHGAPVERARQMKEMADRCGSLQEFIAAISASAAVASAAVVAVA